MNQENLVLEDLGRAGLKMYQLKHGFKFGTDTVLLSWYASSFVSRAQRRQNDGPHVLELGAGCGAASFLTAGRIDNCRIDAIEVMREPYEVLSENIKINNLTNRMNAFNSDLRELPSEVKSKQYNIVMMNPPFFKRENGEAVPEDKQIRLAGRFEEHGTLEDFVRIASSRVVPTSGYVVMVMHGDRLAESICLYNSNGLTPTHLMAVHPMKDKEASMFLLAGRKGSKATALKIMPPLIINEKTAQGDIINTSKITDIYDKEHEDCFI